MFKLLRRLREWLNNTDCSDDCEVDCPRCGLNSETYNTYKRSELTNAGNNDR